MMAIIPTFTGVMLVAAVLFPQNIYPILYPSYFLIPGIGIFIVGVASMYSLETMKYAACPFCHKSALIKYDWTCDYCHEKQGEEVFVMNPCKHCRRKLEFTHCDHCKNQVTL